MRPSIRAPAVSSVSTSRVAMSRAASTSRSIHRDVVFTFGWEAEGSPVPPGSTTVEITLIPDGDGTRVRLVQRGLPDEIRAGSAEGWDHYLPRLAIAAEGGAPGPDPWAVAAHTTDGRSN